MQRADWLLLLLDKDSLGVEGPEALDPIRIQKGMFLLSKMGPVRDLYEFNPYHWGPFSKDVYSDLDVLASKGFVKAAPIPGQSWSTYAVTSRGRVHAASFGEQLGANDVEWLARLRRFLTTRSFNKLLQDIYKEFPESARQSRFQG